MPGMTETRINQSQPVDGLWCPAMRAPPRSRGCPASRTCPRYDVAIVGVPFDTGVTYRPGARFGPAPHPAVAPGCCGHTTQRWTFRRSPISRWSTPATSFQSIRHRHRVPADRGACDALIRGRRRADHRSAETTRSPIRC